MSPADSRAENIGPEPTNDQLLAMAYADGELDSEAHRAFESRLKSSPELAREVTDLRRLEVLARNVAPAEPMDAEWERLEKDPFQRSGMNLGWGLFSFGAAGTIGWMFYHFLVESDLGRPIKVLTSLAVAGLFLLFLFVLRARLHTLPFDPYREVKR